MGRRLMDEMREYSTETKSNGQPLIQLPWVRNQRLARDLKVLTAMRLEDLTVEETSERFSVTVRTIFRIMRRCREATADLESEDLQAFAAAAD